MTTPATEITPDFEARERALKAEIKDLRELLEDANHEAARYEHKWEVALAKIEQLKSDEAAVQARPFRPDVKRIDAGDWTRASSQCVCDVCGYQYWEHAPVPGFEWVHRLCDGKLVKL